MQDRFSRTEMLFGTPALATLADSSIAVFGVGGVGGYVVEVLARSGVGRLDLVDNDCVSITNINRQIIALTSTIGRYKVDVAEERIKDINPLCNVNKYKMFYLPENADGIDLSQYDYVVDCIDTVTAKIELIKRCYASGIPVISSMGAANKLNPTDFKVSDIYKTKMDPLAKVIRKKCKELGIKRLKVVYSEEQPLSPILSDEGDTDTPNNKGKRITPASNAFVPAAAGLIIGGEVIKEILYRAGTMRTSDKEVQILNHCSDKE